MPAFTRESSGALGSGIRQCECGCHTRPLSKLRRRPSAGKMQPRTLWPQSGQRCVQRSFSVRANSHRIDRRQQVRGRHTSSGQARGCIVAGGSAVGAAAVVEEVVEAQDAELMSFTALPQDLLRQRDQLLRLQNLESLTEELAKLSQDLERLTTSEAARTSDAPASREVSEEDYKRLDAARKQHELDLQARRELRAARRKASAKKAASERAKLQAGHQQELAASSAPAIAARSDVRPGRGEARAGKAGPLAQGTADPLLLKGRAQEGRDRKLTGARATAAARTRRHSAWGKRHVAKASRGSFSTEPAPGAASKSNGALAALSNATKLEGFGSTALLTATEERKLGRKVQSLLALEAKRNEAMERLGRDLLTTAEWMAEAGLTDAKEYKKILKEGEAARLRMCKSNERLVWHVARKYQNRGLDIEDLVAEGMIGLLKGVEKYDPEKGFKFSTYAHWWVRQGVTRAISEQARVIRVPVHIHEQMARLAQEDSEFRSRHGYAPSQLQLAGLMGITLERLQTMVKAYQPATSMNAPMSGYGEPGDTVGDHIADTGSARPEDFAQARSLEQDVNKVLGTLQPREAEILRARYGLQDGKLKTLEEVGEIFDVTRERIRQIEAKAILKLRTAERSNILLHGYINQQVPDLSWRAATSKARS